MDDLEQRLVLRGVMLDAQALAVELGQDLLDRRVLVNLHMTRPAMRPFFFLRLAAGLGLLNRRFSGLGFSLRLAKLLVFLLLVFAEQAKVGVRLAELGQGVLGLKIMHRLLVAFPNSNQVTWEQFLLRIALLEVLGEITAVPPDRPRKLVERLQQLENLAELFLRHFLVVL